MKRSVSVCTGFSLVEITLAIGVAAFCFVAILGMLPVGLTSQQTSVEKTTANGIISQIVTDLRADIRLPPGKVSKESSQGFSLHGHWAAAATPDTLYFTKEGKQTGSVSAASAPTDAVFKATVIYLSPPTVTTSAVVVTVNWPAGQNDLTKAAGFVEMVAAVNR